MPGPSRLQRLRQQSTSFTPPPKATPVGPILPPGSLYAAAQAQRRPPVPPPPMIRPDATRWAQPVGPRPAVPPPLPRGIAADPFGGGRPIQQKFAPPNLLETAMGAQTQAPPPPTMVGTSPIQNALAEARGAAQMKREGYVDEFGQRQGMQDPVGKALLGFAEAVDISAGAIPRALGANIPRRPISAAVDKVTGAIPGLPDTGLNPFFEKTTPSPWEMAGSLPGYTAAFMAAPGGPLGKIPVQAGLDVALGADLARESGGVGQIPAEAAAFLPLALLDPALGIARARRGLADPLAVASAKRFQREQARRAALDAPAPEGVSRRAADAAAREAYPAVREIQANERERIREAFERVRRERQPEVPPVVVVQPQVASEVAAPVSRGTPIPARGPRYPTDVPEGRAAVEQMQATAEAARPPRVPKAPVVSEQLTGLPVPPARAAAVPIAAAGAAEDDPEKQALLLGVAGAMAGRGRGPDVPVPRRPVGHWTLPLESVSTGRQGLLKRLGDADEAYRTAHTERARAALLDEAGQDVIAPLAHPGLRVKSTPSAGIWEGKSNPNTIVELEGLPDDPVAARAVVRKYMGMRGIVEGQDMQFMFRSVADDAGPDAKWQGAVLTADRPLSPADIEAIQALSVKYPALKGATLHPSGKVILINTLGTPDAEFLAQTEAGLKELDNVGTFERELLRFDGELDGPGDYTTSVGGDPATLRELAGILRERVRPVYERAAADLGADAAELSRFDDLAAQLDEQAREAEEAAGLVRPKFKQKKGADPATVMAAETMAAKARELYGGSVRNASREVRRARLLQAGLENLEEAISEIPEGEAFYGKNIDTAYGGLRIIVPELAEEGVEALHSGLAAITSSGQKVDPNWTAATKILDQYLQTGQLSRFDVSEPVIEGRGAKSGQRTFRGKKIAGVRGTTRDSTMQAAIADLDMVLKVLQEAGLSPVEARLRLSQILNSLTPATQAKAERAGTFSFGRMIEALRTGEIPRDVAGDLLATEELVPYRPVGEREGIRGLSEKEWVPASTQILAKKGPKIGRFYLNLRKFFDEATIDLWMKRWAMQAQGYADIKVSAKGKRGVMDAPTAAESAEWQEALREIGRAYNQKHGANIQTADVQALLWFWTKRRYSELGSVSPEDTFAGATRNLLFPKKPRPGVGAPGAVSALALGGGGAAVGGTTIEEDDTFAQKVGKVFAGAAAGLGAAGAGAAGIRRAMKKAPGAAASTIAPPTPAPVGRPRIPEVRQRIRTAVSAALERAAAAARGESDFLRKGGPFRSSNVPEPPRPGELPDKYEAFARDNPDFDPAEYLNPARFNQEEHVQKTLAEETERVAAEMGVDYKQREPWDKVREAAALVAARWDLKPEEFTELQPGRMNRAEVLAVANRVDQNVQALRQWSEFQKLATSADDIELAEGVIESIQDENNVLLGKLMRAGTEKGRELNAMKIEAANSLDPIMWKVRARRLSRDGILTAADDAAIEAVINDVKAGKLTPAQGRAKMVSTVHGMIKSTNLDKFLTLRKAGLLSGPKTHAKNILSNAAMGTMETLKDQPATLIDRALGVMVNSLSEGKTGGRTVTKAGSLGQFAAAMKGGYGGVREVGNFYEIPAVWKAMKAGNAQKAGKILANAIRTKELPAMALQKYDAFRHVNFDSPFFDLWTKGIFGGLAAQDRVFKLAAYASAIEEQARVIAMREHLKPGSKQFEQRVGELIASKRDDLHAAAVSAAEIATFTNKGLLAGAVGSAKTYLRKRSPAAGAVADWILPFTSTPANVASRVAEYGFGAVPATIDLVKLIKASAKASKGIDADQLDEILRLQKAVAERGGRNITGLGTLVAGLWLADKGLMTGSKPEKADEWEAWQAAGKTPNSILINGRWRRMEGISPLGNLMVVGANMRTAFDDPEATLLSAMAVGGGTVGQTVSEQSFLQGLDEAQKALKESKRYALGYLAKQPASLIPTLVRQIAQGLDPVVRETRPSEGGTLLQQAGRQFKAGIPFASKTLPARTTELGDTIKRNGGVWRSLFDPFYSQKDLRRDDPLIAELDRVGAGLTKLSRWKDLGEGGEAFRGRKSIIQPVVRQNLEAAIKSQEYLEGIPQKVMADFRAQNPKGEPDPVQFWKVVRSQQRDALEKLASDVKSEGNKQVKQQYLKKPGS